MADVEYFVEAYPGSDLEKKIMAKKTELIETLGTELVDNAKLTKFLRDTPHFTLQVANAKDFEAMLDAYRNVAGACDPITYEIVELGYEVKGGFVEVHSVPHPDHAAGFKNLHLAIIKASRPHLSEQFTRMFDPAKLSGEFADNVRYCHFGPSRRLYRPHASVGRFAPQVMGSVSARLTPDVYQTNGTYVAPELRIWKYVPGDPTFRTVDEPIVIPLGMK